MSGTVWHYLEMEITAKNPTHAALIISIFGVKMKVSLAIHAKVSDVDTHFANLLSSGWLVFVFHRFLTNTHKTLIDVAKILQIQ